MRGGETREMRGGGRERGREREGEGERGGGR